MLSESKKQTKAEAAEAAANKRGPRVPLEDVEHWSEARRESFKRLKDNPNTYYYRHCAPGVQQRNGPWSKEEQASFMRRVAEFGENIGKNWGVFSMAIPGRVGYQCSNYYRLLIKQGKIKDAKYKVTPSGQLEYIARKTRKKSPGDAEDDMAVDAQAESATGTAQSGRSRKRKSTKAARAIKPASFSDEDEEEDEDQLDLEIALDDEQQSDYDAPPDDFDADALDFDSEVALQAPGYFEDRSEAVRSPRKPPAPGANGSGPDSPSVVKTAVLGSSGDRVVRVRVLPVPEALKSSKQPSKQPKKPKKPKQPKPVPAPPPRKEWSFQTPAQRVAGAALAGYDESDELLPRKRRVPGSMDESDGARETDEVVELDQSPFTVVYMRWMDELDSIDLCSLCGSRGVEPMLVCVECGESYHFFCIGLSVLPPSRVWRCNDCKLCNVCGSAGDEAQLLVCDSCDEAYHTFCLKLADVPGGHWECPECEQGEAARLASLRTPTRQAEERLISSAAATRANDQRRCVFCFKNGDCPSATEGRLLHAPDSRSWAHCHCALWAKGVMLDGTHLIGIERAANRAAKTLCAVCNRAGATVACADASCQSAFHLLCAITRRCQFRADLTVLCPLHRRQSACQPREELFEELCVQSLRVTRTRKFNQTKRRKSENDLNFVPIRMGSVTLAHPGFPVDEESYWSDGCALPIGFTVLRRFWSTTLPSQRTQYMYQITEGPKFVLYDYEQNRSMTTDGPEKSWKFTIERLNRLRQSHRMTQCRCHSTIGGMEAAGLQSDWIRALLDLQPLYSLPEAASLFDELCTRQPLFALPRRKDHDKPAATPTLPSATASDSCAAEHSAMALKTEAIEAPSVSIDESSLPPLIEADLLAGDALMDDSIVSANGLELAELEVAPGASNGSFSSADDSLVDSSSEVTTQTMAEQTAERVRADLMERIIAARMLPAGRLRRIRLTTPRVPASEQQSLASSESEMRMFRALQTEGKQRLAVRRSKIHRLGLFARESFATGEMIVEVIGQLIQTQLADRRAEIYAQSKQLDCHLFEVTTDLVIDATHWGNIGRFINHSCQANACGRVLMVEEQLKLVLFATRNVHVGEEITCSYGLEENSEDFQSKVCCNCGASECRQFLN